MHPFVYCRLYQQCVIYVNQNHTVLGLVLVGFSMLLKTECWSVQYIYTCGKPITKNCQLGEFVCYLLILCLRKDIQSHAWPYSFLCLQITRSVIRQYIKWAVNLVIVGGHLILLRGCASTSMYGLLTLSPRGLVHLGLGRWPIQRSWVGSETEKVINLDVLCMTEVYTVNLIYTKLINS